VKFTLISYDFICNYINLSIAKIQNLDFKSKFKENHIIASFTLLYTLL